MTWRLRNISRVEEQQMPELNSKNSKQHKTLPAGKVARVPLVMQMESQESMAASLVMVLAYYSKWVSLENIREECGISLDSGTIAENGAAAARAYGLEASISNTTVSELRGNGTFPCIVQNKNHTCCVLCGIREKKYI